MTGKLTEKNNNTTLILEYEDLSPMPSLTIEHMAHKLWDRNEGDHGTLEEPIDWDDLTEQDYVDIAFDCIMRVILDLAAQHVYDSAIADAARQAKVLSESQHGLGE